MKGSAALPAFHNIKCNRLVQRRDGALSSGECSGAGAWRSGIVPVGTINNSGLGAEALTAEAEIVGTERAVRVTDAAKVAGDATVEANGVTRGAAQVTLEVTKTGMELFEDDGLGLNFTDLLSDDTLGHLLKYKQTLLNDLHGLSVAD